MSPTLMQRMPDDRFLHELAAFTSSVSVDLDHAAKRGAKAVMMDTLAVAMGALEHPAAKIARRYAAHAKVAEGATIWGAGELVTAEAATLVNGVPVRGYDYNDLYLGKKGGGHPSDMLPGLIALAEWRKLSGMKLMQATALGYEVTLNLCDIIDLSGGGWDYPNTIAIGATCAAARLLNLTYAQTREALSITVIPHFCSGEVESNDLNSRDDLTMWKRFNGSDAIRQSVYACLLAEAGAEGAVRPFEGNMGFLSKVKVAKDDIEALFVLLSNRPPLGRITENTFKRWPVGSRGQSAIQASLQARANIEDIRNIKNVQVFTDEAVFDHLVSQRADPWHPSSRETADHSLPYIVAAAVLDGEIKVSSFDSDAVSNPKRQQFLSEKVKVEPARELSKGGKAGFLTRVEITDENGKVHIGEAKAPPGHTLQPFTDQDHEAKFRENVAPLLGSDRTSRIIELIWKFDNVANVRELISQLVLSDRAAEA